MYQFSTSLKAHEQDVKDIVAIDDTSFSSCSRDGSVKTWFREQSNGNNVAWDHIVVHQSTDKSYINCLAFIEGIVYDGGNNKLIQGFPYLSNIQENENEPVFSLSKHTANVCSLSSFHDAVSGDNFIISCSWDSTAIVWKNNEFLFQLRGHQSSVWDAKIINPTTFITCSADKTVKLWSENTCVKTFENLHNDVIRSVDVDLENSIFATSSNDGLIQVCDLQTGVPKATLRGHDSFVYKVQFAQNQKLISCGEDRTLRVWDMKKMAEQQCIVLPAISIWSFDQLSNGDVVVGSSDRMIRIFTESAERRASPEQLKSFAEEVSSSSISSKTIDESSISPYEILSRPGKKDGQVVVVKSPQGNLEAHQYSNNAWVKVGDVVGGVGSEKKVEHEGKKYDYVFDVDIEEGKPPLKLPYNANDNVYSVAENFLSKYELPAYYREDIVKFIIQNTGGVAMDNADPATQAQPASTYAVPASKIQGFPYTIHYLQYLKLANFKKEALLKGLAKININEETQIAEEQMVEFQNALDNPASNVDFLYTQAEFIKHNWKMQLPAYDIMRIITPFLPSSSKVVPFVHDGLASDDLGVNMLTVRCLVNCFQNEEWGIPFLEQVDIYESVFKAMKTDIPDTFKQRPQLLVAIATLFFNYSVLMVRKNKLEMVPVVADALNNKFGASHIFLDNEEAAYRLLVAFGHLATIEPTLKQFAKSIKWVKEVETKYGDDCRFLEFFGDFGFEWDT
ncbi:hypothetical protein ACO0QE_003000 [Hanseniaspora vineae]